MSRLRHIALIALTALLVGFAAPALAAESPVNDAYGSTVNLPITGLDLGLIAAGGMALVALGFGLRRVTRTQP